MQDQIEKTEFENPLDFSSPSSSQDLDKPLSCDNFEKVHLLGSGSFGKVFQVRKKDGHDKGKIYAMKVLRKEKIVDNQVAIRHIVSERNILKSVKHIFVIEMIYAFQCQDKFYFILEFLSGGTLEQLLLEQNCFTEIQGRFYASEIILAIEYLHSKEIMHRDLKAENILLDRDGHVKISDFGLSKDHLADGERTYTRCGTLVYAAPEILRKDGSGHGKEVDWWALGILIYRMIIGKFPFDADNNRKLVQLVKNGSFQFAALVSFDAQDLIRGFLTVNVEERLGSSGVQEIKTHFFFEDTCWDFVLERMEKPPFVPKFQFPDVNIHDDADSTSIKFNINDSQNNLFKGFSFVNTKDARTDSFIYKENLQRIMRRKLLKMFSKFIRKMFIVGNRRQRI